MSSLGWDFLRRKLGRAMKGREEKTIKDRIELNRLGELTPQNEVKLWQLAKKGPSFSTEVFNLLKQAYPTAEEKPLLKLSKMLVIGGNDALHTCVLLAIDTNLPHLLAVILRRVKQRGQIETSSCKLFRNSYASPLMVACLNKSFDMTAVLLAREGHEMPAPHNIKCTCEECLEWREKDHLMHSQYVTDLFGSMCSAPFFWLACADPMAAACKMALEMRRQANDNPEYQVALREIMSGCLIFCGDLINLLRSSEEVEIVLKGMHPIDSDTTSKYPGMDLAINCSIKPFICHPGINAHLEKLSKGSWNASDPMEKWKNMFIHVFYPITAPIFMLSGGKIFPTFRTPFYRFVSFSTSYMVILVILLTIMKENDSTDAGFSNYGGKLAMQWYVFIYFFGMLISDVETIHRGTFTKFIGAWWHWLDIFSFTVYSLSFFMWCRAELCSIHIPDVHRNHWPWWEPTLLYESTFAFANALSFLRIFYFVQLLKFCGPTVISIGRCIPSVLVHICVIFVETMAFTAAINNLFENYYDNSVIFPDGTKDDNPNAFTSIAVTLRWLYWAWFGYTHPYDMRMVVGNAGDQVIVHDVTEFVGEFLIALYYGVTMIILMNLLISMMTGTAAAVTANEDEEWMWERAYIWHEFTQQHFTLPSPFNILHIIYINVTRFTNKLRKIKPKPIDPSISEKYEKLMDELMIRFLDTYEHSKMTIIDH